MATASALEHLMKEVPGIFIENKIYSLSVHYRNVKKEEVPKDRKFFEEALKKFQVKYKIRVAEGKKVWEIRPDVEWNKGTAAVVTGTPHLQTEAAYSFQSSEEVFYFWRN